MSSLPFSILLTKNEEIIPLLSIQEHQKFCKSLLKSYLTYKNKISDEKLIKIIIYQSKILCKHKKSTTKKKY